MVFTRSKSEVVVAAPSSNGHGSNGHVGNGRWHPTRSLRRPAVLVLVAALAAAGTLVGIEATSATTTYPASAVFASAPGLFPGAAVEVVGVTVGTVTSVTNVGDEVKVGLAIDRGRPVPANATASLVTPELLGEPSIDLAPGYTGGPTLRAGTVIPMSRTAVPVSTETLLKQLEKTLKTVNPTAVGNLVTNLAEDLNGQGKALNTLISGAAGTLKLLATKADDLGQLNGSLAQLTGTLDSRTAEISQLITDYDTVSNVIAQHSTQLGGAITELSQASTQLVQLLAPNLSSLETDVGTITTVGRTLDRNLTSVDEIFAAATALFEGAGRAYTATYNWLTLNLQTPAGVTGALLADMVTSRLAGVCRRILRNHSTGLSATEIKTLTTCSTPNSSFFAPIVDQVTTILADIEAGKTPTASTTPSQMIQQGLAKIAAGTSTKSATSTAPSTTSGSTTRSSSSTTTKTKTTTTSTTKTKTKTKKTCLGGLLGGLTTCSKSKSTGGGSKSGGGTTGLGGLLSYRSALPTSSTASGAATDAAPSLTAAATKELPQLPAGAPGATRALDAQHRRAQEGSTKATSKRARHKSNARKPTDHNAAHGTDRGGSSSKGAER